MNFVTGERRSETSIEVPIVSLDGYCAQRGIETIDLLKVDVQGNEPAVFVGARGLID